MQECGAVALHERESMDFACVRQATEAASFVPQAAISGRKSVEGILAEVVNFLRQNFLNQNCQPKLQFAAKKHHLLYNE